MEDGNAVCGCKSHCFAVLLGICTTFRHLSDKDRGTVFGPLTEDENTLPKYHTTLHVLNRTEVPPDGQAIIFLN